MTIVPAANQDNRQNQMIVRSRIMPDNLYAGGDLLCKRTLFPNIQFMQFLYLIIPITEKRRRKDVEKITFYAVLLYTLYTICVA